MSLRQSIYLSLYLSHRFHWHTKAKTVSFNTKIRRVSFASFTSTSRQSIVSLETLKIMANVTRGAIAGILSNQPVERPVLQVIIVNKCHTKAVTKA